ncbi:MAG: FAD-binding oxidoreductase [Thermoanaerobaculia bacterium]
MKGSDARTTAPVSHSLLSSFDGGVVAEEDVARPDRYRHLQSFNEQPIIARGGGYSYTAASFGAGGVVADMRAFNRVLAFDPKSGVLQCEAGATLRTVYDVATSLGWHLPVQPGYPAITIGGCIAADVHGKNQYRDGTFRQHVESMTIFHPAHGETVVSAKARPDIFELTAGGFGLTGNIMSATIQLKRLPGPSLQMQRVPVRSIADFVPMLERLAPQSDLLYTWHNFTAKRDRFGEGFVYTARFVDAAHGHRGPERVRKIDASSRGRYRVQLLNRSTTPAFNRAYETLQRLSPATYSVSLFDALFPVANKVVFFELFGSRGFHEYQLLLPADAFVRFCSEVRDYVVKDRTPVALASCKLFRGKQSLLRFDGTGMCIALDFPRDRRSGSFAQFLDELTIRHGGIPNISKDSRLPATVVRAAYPDYERFRAALREWDPKRTYRSEVSERLEL